MPPAHADQSEQSEADDGLIHPEAVGVEVNLRVWFYGVLLPWLVALAAGALLAAEHRSTHPAAQAAWLLALFAFYMTLACTLVPLPTTPVVAAMASQFLGLADDPVIRVALVAAVGGVATTMANLNDYHLFTFLLRKGKVASIRRTRLYETAVHWFRVSPWWTLVAFSYIPIPVDVVRLLAITWKYPRWRFLTSNLVGRVSRYATLAGVVAAFDRRPSVQLWLVAGIAVLSVGLGLTWAARRLWARWRG